jgi:crotonobetainyl-CoA:carnitine CoA-transferase CaiB-like acyl-CoA transferase
MHAPLSGLQVADFSHVFAGPYCTMVLADLGAEVIKIESPAGDSTRAYPPEFRGQSPSFLSMNRNKKGVILDLRQELGREVALDIIARSDILVENFATGVMERLGLGPTALLDRQSQLIYCSISAYGREGSSRDRAGYDYVIQAETGLMSLNGYADGQPHKTAIPFVDLSSGMHAATAILAAVVERQKTGKGQYVEVALFDTAVNLAGFQIMNYLASGINPQRLGNHSSVVAPVDVFDTSDGSFFMNIAGDRVWNKLVAALGHPPQLLDPKYAANGDRVRHQAKLIALLQDIFAQRRLRELIETLRAAGVPAGPILTIEEATKSPEVIERELIGLAPHSTSGMVPNVRSPFSFSRSPVVRAVGAPDWGEHSRSVLEDMLGYSKERVDQLVTSGVVGVTSPTSEPHHA